MYVTLSPGVNERKPDKMFSHCDLQMSRLSDRGYAQWRLVSALSTGVMY